MLIDAIARNEADGVAVVETHPDSEIFRVRLGKALNFDFLEDSVGETFRKARSAATPAYPQRLRVSGTTLFSR